MQGFNMGRYVPPDQEGLVTSGNRLHGVHAQKANAAGVPIVRFEMPFAVWCDGCQAQQAQRQPVLIGQGVRFNAEKHRTGAYHSTPVWTFRMRHPACGSWLAIRTDPANTAYVVESGGRRRREYEDEDDHGGAVARDGDGDGAMDRLDAFDRLERTIAHRTAAAAVETTSTAPETGEGAGATADAPPLPPINPVQRINGLARANARQWQDPYGRNRALRAAFRAGRHARQQAAADDDALRARLGGLSADLPLLPATDEDAQYAALVEFGRRGGYEGGSGSSSGNPAPQTPVALADRRTLAKPLFGGLQCSPAALAPSMPTAPTTTSSSPSSSNTFSSTTQTARRRQAIRNHLAATVVANTRMAVDPFLLGGRTPLPDEDGGSKRMPPLRRLVRLKRGSQDEGKETAVGGASGKKQRQITGDGGADDGAAAVSLAAQQTEATGSGHSNNRSGDETVRPPGAATALLVNYDSD